MGNVWQRLQRKFFNKDVRLVFLGLDAAGKTSTLYRLKLGDVVTTIPTIGFNVETIEYKNINFTAWDIGGRDKIRPLFHHYFEKTDAVILVVDSGDKERISECKEEFWRLIVDENLKSAVLLVMANKQDLHNAMSVEEITENLELHKLEDREWHIQGTSATTGDGLYEGLNWLEQTLTRKEVKKAVVKPVKEVVASVSPKQEQGQKPTAKLNKGSWWSILTNYFTRSEAT